VGRNHGLGDDNSDDCASVSSKPTVERTSLLHDPATLFTGRWRPPRSFVFAGVTEAASSIPGTRLFQSGGLVDKAQAAERFVNINE